MQTRYAVMVQSREGQRTKWITWRVEDSEKQAHSVAHSLSGATVCPYHGHMWALLVEV